MKKGAEGEKIKMGGLTLIHTGVDNAGLPFFARK
jgi:hypothetical protein